MTTWWNDVGGRRRSPSTGPVRSTPRRACVSPSSDAGGMRLRRSAVGTWGPSGLLTSVRTGHSTFRYHVTVPLFLFGGQVKVALAWDSKVFSSERR